jgi:hypothetical protein
MKRSQERLPFTHLVAWALLACVIPGPSFAAVRGDQVLYLGGTLRSLAAGVKGTLSLDDPKVAVFSSPVGRIEIPYSQVTRILYSQMAKRRIRSGKAAGGSAAILVAGGALFGGPVAVPLLLTKRRNHYVTVFFTGEDGTPQIAAFELGKKMVRLRVHELEARTGKIVEFETEQAKKNFGQ